MLVVIDLLCPVVACGRHVTQCTLYKAGLSNLSAIAKVVAVRYRGRLGVGLLTNIHHTNLETNRSLAQFAPQRTLTLRADPTDVIPVLQLMHHFAKNSQNHTNALKSLNNHRPIIVLFKLCNNNNNYYYYSTCKWHRQIWEIRGKCWQTEDSLQWRYVRGRL